MIGVYMSFCFFFKQKTAYEMRISDWSSDVCSSDLTAGGLMNTDTVTVRPDVTLDVVQRYLRLRGELPAHTDALFVVDRYSHYLGALPLDRILTRNPDEVVSNVMARERDVLNASLSAERVAQQFQHADPLSAPVLAPTTLPGARPEK